MSNPAATCADRMFGATVQSSAVLGRCGVGSDCLYKQIQPVGARNSAALCDLPVFVDCSTESVPSDDLDVGGRCGGEWS